MKPKKSLPLVTKTMLPEVLPDPRRPAAGASAPRHRTMAHMQRLLATAAAVGVASAGASTATVAVAGAATAGCGKSTKLPDASDDKNGDKNGNTSGYAVVDPMPPPAHCPGLASSIAATAKFVRGDGGGLLLSVRFARPKGRDDYKYVAGAVSVAYGAKVLANDVQADAVVVLVQPDAGVSEVTVTVKGTCNEGPSNIMANVSWKGGAISETTPATINLNDVYSY